MGLAVRCRQTSATVEDIMTDDPDPETLKQIERALRKMPRLQREIFLAARLDDMSNAEIAERTGRTIADVERAFAKALASVDRSTSEPPRRWWRRR